MNFTFTKQGFDDILKEQKLLTEKKHKEAVERLAKARAMGDLRENSEYHAAKEDLARVVGRMKELDVIVAKAHIVEDAPKGVVGLGSRVEVQIGTINKTFSIVGELESNITEGKLSHVSPIGKALVGKKAGDVATVHAPAGTIEYTIVKVS